MSVWYWRPVEHVLSVTLLIWVRLRQRHIHYDMIQISLIYPIRFIYSIFTKLIFNLQAHDAYNMAVKWLIMKGWLWINVFLFLYLGSRYYKIYIYTSMDIVDHRWRYWHGWDGRYSPHTTIHAIFPHWGGPMLTNGLLFSSQRRSFGSKHSLLASLLDGGGIKS